MIIKTKICGRCGEPYVSEDINNLMCMQCEKEIIRIKHGVKVRHCKICDKPYTSKYSYQKYCSDKCRKESVRRYNAKLRYKERKMLGKRNLYVL